MAKREVNQADSLKRPQNNSFLLKENYTCSYGPEDLQLDECCFADEWVRGFRDVPHAQQDTTGACEGYHSAIKGSELARKSRLQGRRVDWLLYLVWNEVCCYVMMC